jgi:hypothetical protein
MTHRLVTEKGAWMIDTPHHMNKQSLPAALRRAPGAGPLRLLLAFGASLALGGLGDSLAWQWLENPWPFFDLLCPPARAGGRATD